MERLSDKIIITLSLEPSFRRALKKLLSFSNNVEDIWNNFTKNDFLSCGLNNGDYENFLLIKGRGFSSKEYQTFLKENIRVIFYQDSDFPANLKNIQDPPYFLFVRGKLDLNIPFSIVGSRKASRYGVIVTESISSKLAKAGMTIVSGLALGIDAIAHRGALSVKGKTVAVLGTVVNDASIYPQTNWGLAQKILESGGSIISEYPPFYPIHKMNFPERNRIISGISNGVLIAEAREKSGALITADFALEQGRDVFAIPHDITRVESVGGNNLLKEGAFVVTSAKDITNFYEIYEEPQDKNIFTEKEGKIFSLLGLESLHINELSKQSGLTIEDTSATLSLMEIKGLVTNNGAGVFSVNK
ncbi:DNA-protecting protein DprA [bacterium]|nr:DNA-protecting protein DprA [bacterium]